MTVNDVNQEVIDTRIRLIMGGYHTRLATAFTNGVFRARKNIGDQLFELISDLWYPPARFITKRGRFNEPGQAAFYACTRGNGAVFEVRPEVGDYVTVLVVKTKEKFSEIQCAHIGLERNSARELVNVRKTNILRNDASFRSELEQFGIYNKWLAIADHPSV